MVKDPYSKAIELTANVLEEYNFVLIGGQAVNAWMVDEEKIRATQDIDFLLDAPEEDAFKISNEFRQGGYTVHLRMGKPTDEIPLYLRLTSEVLPQIDIIFAQKPWEKEIAASGKVIDDFCIKLASAENLILLKALAGSEIDMIDIKNLITSGIDQIDTDRLRRDAKKIKHNLPEKIDRLFS